MITISALAASAYRVFVGAPPRLCRGYGLAAPALWPGGPDGRVDCIGNCDTGAGYCYATADSKCAPCLLYPPLTGLGYGQRLCSDLGEAQGGPLFGTADWTTSGCPTNLPTPPVQVRPPRLDLALLRRLCRASPVLPPAACQDGLRTSLRPSLRFSPRPRREA